MIKSFIICLYQASARSLVLVHSASNIYIPIVKEVLEPPNVFPFAALLCHSFSYTVILDVIKGTLYVHKNSNSVNTCVNALMPNVHICDAGLEKKSYSSIEHSVHCKLYEAWGNRLEWR